MITDRTYPRKTLKDFMKIIDTVFGTHSEREIKRIMPLVDKIEKMRPEMMALSDAELQAKTPEFKDRLAKGETLDDILPEAFAAFREASWRVLNMKHFPVQIIGGIILSANTYGSCEFGIVFSPE